MDYSLEYMRTHARTHTQTHTHTHTQHPAHTNRDKGNGDAEIELGDKAAVSLNLHQQTVISNFDTRPSCDDVCIRLCMYTQLSCVYSAVNVYSTVYVYSTAYVYSTVYKHLNRPPCTQNIPRMILFRIKFCLGLISKNRIRSRSLIGI